MIDPALLSRCDDLLVACARETAQMPRYIIDADSLDGLPTNRGDCLGWFYNWPIWDRNIIDRLGDRYHGPGILICLDDKAIEAAAQPGQFERCVLNTMAHEVGHVDAVRKAYEPGDTPQIRELQHKRMAEGFKAPTPEPGSPNDPHDWKFVRRATHVYYRARILGFDLTPHQLFGQSWMSTTQVYLDTLLPELVAMAGATFDEIARTPAPRDFVAQWESDLKFYRDIFVKGPSCPHS